MSKPETISWEPSSAERAETARIVARLQEVRAERARLDGVEARLLDDALSVAHRQVERARGRLQVTSEWDMPIRSMAAELAVAVRDSPRGMEHRMAEAMALVEDFPATLAEVDEGRIDGRRAQVIVAEGGRIADVSDRGEYEQRAIMAAGETTAAGLRPRCRVIADAFDVATLAERHAAARAKRAVLLRLDDDGMAELRLHAPVPLVQGIYDRLTAMGRALIRDQDRHRCDREGDGNDRDDEIPDPRRMDALRADLACELLLAGSPVAHAVDDGDGGNLLDSIRGTVQVTIPVRTLVGHAHQPVTASGTGENGHAPAALPPGGRSPVPTVGSEPVDSGTARRIAGRAAGWERLFHDPDTGALLAVDHYTPTTAQKRMIHARDEHCRFPGCRLPSHRGDIDHSVPHSRGGPTSVDNLESLCRRHHTLKHHSPWRLRHLGAGELEWTSPLGYRYRDRPESGVRFAETTAAEPMPF